MTIRHDIRADRKAAAARRASARGVWLGGRDRRGGRAAARHAAHLMRSARRERFASMMGR